MDPDTSRAQFVGDRIIPLNFLHIRPWDCLMRSRRPVQAAAIQQINQELRQLRANIGMFTSSIMKASSRVMARPLARRNENGSLPECPCGGLSQIYLAREWLRFVIPLSGRTAKVLVTDLDNTMWGGVIGEDGFGLESKLGPEYPGAAYQNLQRAMLNLGAAEEFCWPSAVKTILKMRSKHWKIIRECYSDQKLFPAVRTIGTTKAQNLREIRLRIERRTRCPPLFLDDNPVEREQVRGACLRLQSIDLPQILLAMLPQFEIAGVRTSGTLQ